MKKVVLFLILFFNIFICIALANKLSKIELADGSVVIGEVSGINDGKYTINSPEMGVLQIEGSRIKKIILDDTEKKSDSTIPLGYGPSSDQIETMKNKILSDKETMGMVSALQNDPQFQEIINDPQIINAIKSGNTTSLITNEKLIRLKDNPIFKEIQNRTEQETP